MSARSQNLVKLAIEQKPKEILQSSCVNPISDRTLKVVENHKPGTHIEFDIENLVDAGLIFENEQLNFIDNQQCVPLEVNSTNPEPVCSSADNVHTEACVLPLNVLPAHINTDLQCFENRDIVDVDINGLISLNTTDEEHLATERECRSTGYFRTTPTDEVDFPVLSDSDDPDYNIAPSDENSEDETDAEKNIAPPQNATYENQEETNTEEAVHLNRSKRAQPENWKRERNKVKRMKGENYLGYTRTRDGKVSHNVQRDSRKSVHCESEYCLRNKRFCSSISIEDSQKLFSKFWSLSWDEKKVYVCSLVDYNPKKRSYTAGPSRRSGTFIYQLKVNNEKLKVCKRMFLGTLGLKEKMVHCWLKKSSSGIVEKTERVGNNNEASRENEKRRNHLNTFFNELPKQPSHYCRKDSSKVYLEQTFQTKSQIYKLYKDNCLENNIEPYTLFPFYRVFEEMNLSIFRPKKDECDVCYGYKIKQISEDDYNAHFAKKTRARLEKNKNKEEALQNQVYTFTMDTQAVKLCPFLNVGAFYYKTKLQIHNFTIYNLESHSCVNYVWNESEGDLSASIFATCIIKHLKENCLADKKPIILFSDGCCYQNRNAILSNALLHFSIEHNVVIVQKYLEKGHTQMECDSVHALIEKKLKYRIIQLPSEYISVIREARSKPKPFDVCYLTHDQFINFDDKSSFIYNSIRPGRNVNDPTVTDLRALMYTPEGKLFYKINFDDDYKELPQRPKQNNIKIVLFQRLFQERLKIKHSKWLHLQQLKTHLTSDTHSFYDCLPHHIE